MTALTKRSRWGAAAVAGVLLLSGCGEDETTGGTPTTAAPPTARDRSR